MSDHSAYLSPFSTRYASKDMQFIFSEDNKFAHGGSSGSLWPKRKRRRGLPSPTSRLPSWKPIRTTSTTRTPSAGNGNAVTT